MTPIEEIPTPDFAVPYAAPISVKHVNVIVFEKLFRNVLAKQRAAVTPMNPKKGAEVGQVS